MLRNRLVRTKSDAVVIDYGGRFALFGGRRGGAQGNLGNLMADWKLAVSGATPYKIEPLK